MAGHLIAALAAILLLLLVANFSWFDEPLLPELATLRAPQPISIDDNAYVLSLGFLAGDDRNPRNAGAAIVRALHERFEQGRAITLSAEEMRSILGGSNLESAWRSNFESLNCVARVYTDCAERLIAEVTRTEMRIDRLSVLMDRYETILRQARFEESDERDASTPFPPYGLIRAIARLRLAISYERDRTLGSLDKARSDFAFWVALLRDGDALATKMVSLAGIQDNVDFLSTLMRNRSLDDDELLVLREFVRPFTADESDIGEAFVSEARIAVLSDPHPMIYGTSWPIRLLVQENATINEEFLTVFVPVMQRASLSAQQYFDRKAYEPLPYELRAFPPPIFNLGGKLARRSAWDTVELYLARVHDQNGRISLLLLQAEIEQGIRQSLETGSPDTLDSEALIAEIVRSSMHRNPYTDEPMQYDAESQTIRFDCLHTVYHPPARPDTCGVVIGR